MAVTGRAVVLLALGLIVALLQPTMTAVRWWWVVVVVLVAADVVFAPSPAVLTGVRENTPPIRTGESTHTDLQVHNRGTRAVRALIRDAWQPSAGAGTNRHRIALRPGDSATLRTSLTPTRRGDRLSDRVTVRSYGPLGLAARQRSTDIPGVVRALPPFPSRRQLPGLLQLLRQLDGRAAVRTRGQGTEFDSLRDYVTGDDVRSIDWRATARRRTVVVRTWQPERDRHVVIVLDTSRTSAARVQDMPRLDSAMDAALLLTALASRAGDRVDLLAGDRVVHTRVSTSPHSDLLRSVTSALAPVQPALLEADWSTLATAVAERARRRALVVLLTPLEPAAIEEGMLPVIGPLTRRHLVVLASVQDPELTEMTHTVGTEEGAYRAAAAEQTLRRRERTALVLERLGVHVVDATPQVLPTALSTAYLRFKSRGML